jgi:hypothetical protein
MQEKKYSKTKKILLDLATYANVKNIQGLARYTGIKDSTLYTWIDRDKISDVKDLLKIFPNLNLNWLETGEGEMFTGAPGVLPSDELSPEKKYLLDALRVAEKQINYISDEKAEEYASLLRRLSREQQRS